jgi:hypothetical protein
MTTLTAEDVLRGTTVGVAGLAIAVSASDPARAEAVAALLRHALPDPRPADASLAFVAASPSAPTTAAGAVIDGLAMWAVAPDGLFLGVEGSLSAEVSARAIVVGGDAQGLASTFRFIAFVALTHLLAQHDRHLFHGGAVAADGRAVLVVGATGTGKSTAVLGAIAAGWSTLGDDMIVLRRVDGGLSVEGVPRPVAVEAHLLAADVEARPVPGDARQRVELGAGTLVRGPRPVAGIVVPVHGSAPDAALAPLAGHDALRAMLGGNTSLGDRAILPAVFAIAGAVARLPAWTLAHGSEPAQRVESAAACFRSIRAAL